MIKTIAAFAIAGLMVVLVVVGWGIMLNDPNSAMLPRRADTMSLKYLHDVEAGKCFAVLTSGAAVAITQCDCDDVPGSLLLEVQRTEKGGE